eukprot:6173195-Pleurochrysis_carterae.AAC.2
MYMGGLMLACVINQEDRHRIECALLSPAHTLEAHAFVNRASRRSPGPTKPRSRVHQLTLPNIAPQSYRFTHAAQTNLLRVTACLLTRRSCSTRSSLHLHRPCTRAKDTSINSERSAHLAVLLVNDTGHRSRQVRTRPSTSCARRLPSQSARANRKRCHLKREENDTSRADRVSSTRAGCGRKASQWSRGCGRKARQLPPTPLTCLSRLQSQGKAAAAYAPDLHLEACCPLAEH